MVIFTIDNRYFHVEHRLSAKWLPLEECFCTPLIISTPTLHPEHKGTTNDNFTLSIDWVPTVLSAAGLNAPELMQGRDILGFYRNKFNNWRTEFLYEIPYLLEPQSWPTVSGLIRKDFKYIDYASAQLFDMKEDSKEANDSIGAPVHVARIAEMKKCFGELQSTAMIPESHTAALSRPR